MNRLRCHLGGHSCWRPKEPYIKWGHGSPQGRGNSGAMYLVLALLQQLVGAYLEQGVHEFKGVGLVADGWLIDGDEG